MAKKARGSNEGDQPKKDTMKWTDHMDVVLLDALLEQQVNGNRVDGTFTSTAYNNVLKVCREELKYPFDKDHLKNHIKTLKNHFNTCHGLFKGLSGFVWSSTTKMFEAEPEVWNALFEAKPHAKKWRYTEIQNYDKLSDLFAKDRATGEGTMSAKEKVQQWEKEGSSSQFIDVDRQEEVRSESPDPLNPQFNSQSGNTTKNLKRKASTMDSRDKQVEMIQSSINNVAEAIREGNTLAEKGVEVLQKAQPRIYSEEEVYTELLKIGVPDSIVLEAFLFLVNGAQKMRVFFAIPSEKRYELLIKWMYPSTEH
ncbi:hypothetical protein UlMin_011187 [Ulmus minor]